MKMNIWFPQKSKKESGQCFEVNRRDRKWVLFAHANPWQCPFNSLSNNNDFINVSNKNLAKRIPHSPQIYLDLTDGPGH